MYHLHINAARELVGEAFNVEVTALEDICYLPLSSLIQCPTPRHDATLK